MALSDVVAVVDFGGSKTAVAIAGTDGREYCRTVFSTPGGTAAGDSAGNDAAHAVSAAVTAIYRLSDGAKVVSLGVVCPGVVEADGVRLAPHIEGWHELRLVESFREAFPATPVVVDNDVKAAAYAEYSAGALRHADPGMLVSMGTGVALAVIVNGRILRGSHGWAGEIGYGPGVAPDGKRGSVEELIGGAALRSVAASVGVATTAELIDVGLADAAVGRRIARCFEPLLDAVASSCLVVDPQRVAISGGLLAARKLWWQPLVDRLDSILPDLPEVVPSQFGSDASLNGAMLMATEQTVALAPTQRR